MRKALDFTLLTVLLLATIVWLGGDIARMENPFDPADRAKPPWWAPIMPQVSGDDFGAVLEFMITETPESGMPYLAGTAVGYAAYEVSSGLRISSVVMPEDSSELRALIPSSARRVPAGLRTAPEVGYVEAATCVEVETLEYDPVLPDSLIERFAAEGRVAEFPMSVYAVSADRPDDSIVLYRDEGARSIYVVASSLVSPTEVVP